MFNSASLTFPRGRNKNFQSFSGDNNKEDMEGQHTQSKGREKESNSEREREKPLNIKYDWRLNECGLDFWVIYFTLECQREKEVRPPFDRKAFFYNNNYCIRVWVFRRTTKKGIIYYPIIEGMFRNNELQQMYIRVQ